jgi:dTDP-4-dehydrorhamnose reductase
MNAKTILVTGSNGLLGQKVVEALRQRKDVKLIATSKGENRISRQAGYIYESLDITQQGEVDAIIKKYHPNSVLNTAAMTNVDACETQREGCYALNVSAVQYLIQAMEKTVPDAQFIHLSTDFVFDGLKGPYKEEDKPSPLSYYAETKYESEKRVEVCKLKWAIVRTIIVYGVGERMSRSNLILWAKEALSKGQKINVVDDQFRSPTLAEDLAAGCIAVADKEAQGVFHISGPHTFSILELVYKVADFWKLDKSLITPSKSDTLKQPAVRPPRTGFIIDKARKVLGYNPHSFEEGLEVVDRQLKSGF